jgi:hypothetical protein
MLAKGVTMGCDIHFHSEIKYKDRWEHYGTGNFKRNYFMFYLMAGIRGEYPFKPFRTNDCDCDIPDDCSVTTRLSWNKWEPDAHSWQVYNKQDIHDFYKYFNSIDLNIREKHLGKLDAIFLDNQVGYLFGDGWDIVRFPFNSEDDHESFKDINDVRWIFWFDN